MTLLALEKLVNKANFTPFRLVTASGATYDVPHRDFIWLSAVLVGVKNVDGSGVFIDPDLIVSAEVGKPVARKKAL